MLIAVVFAFVSVPVVQADFAGSTQLGLTGPDTTRAPIDYKGQLSSSIAEGSAEANAGQLFFEKSSVITGPALDLTVGGTVPVGTAVNSYILHFDAVGNTGGLPVYEFHETINFDEKVLGLIFDTSETGVQLATSDSIVGLGAGFYETDAARRKLEVNQDYWIDTAIFGTSVTLDLFTNSSMDEVRIVTVPVPGAVLLGMLGLSVVGVKLRKCA